VAPGKHFDPLQCCRGAAVCVSPFEGFAGFFWAVGARREVQQGKNLAEAAKKAGVEHFVYSSVGGAERNSGIDHWESKWEIEKHIRKLGLPATVLRPATFMENYYIDQVEIGILKGKLVEPHPWQ
jgi:uncharacterized protein YbjT (DUF2867 family)